MANHCVMDAICLYLIACALPVMYGHSYYPGWIALMLGWGSAIQLASFAWFANLFLVAAWDQLLSQRWRLAVGAGIIAVGIGLDTFRLQQIPSIDYPDHIEAFGSGTFLWFESMFIMIV